MFRAPRAGWWLAWALFWLLMLTVSVQEHAGSAESWWQPLLWEGSSALVATAMLAAMWPQALAQDAWLARPWRWFALQLRWLPLLAPAFVVAVYALRHAVYAALGQAYEHPPWIEVFVYECTKFALFYTLFVAVIFGLRTHAALAAQRLQTQAAQLAQLTQQLEPHFLFNALNTIAATIPAAPERADALLTQLAALLRAASDLTRRPQCTLAEELRLLEGYSALMVERFGERVRYQQQIDEQALSCRVPTLAVQPLVENAFRHGVEPSSAVCTVVLRVQCRAARLRVEVEQSQGRLPADRAEGVGLETLRRRLAALYGTRAALGLEAAPAGGVRAWFELPCER